MAEYKHPHFLKQEKNEVLFDSLSSAGALTPRSGIYRCQACGHECVSLQDQALPPEDHHRHARRQPIQWRLIVAVSADAALS